MLTRAKSQVLHQLIFRQPDFFRQISIFSHFFGSAIKNMEEATDKSWKVQKNLSLLANTPP